MATSAFSTPFNPSTFSGFNSPSTNVFKPASDPVSLGLQKTAALKNIADANHQEQINAYLASLGQQPGTTATTSSGTAGSVNTSIGPVTALSLSKGGGFDQFTQDALAKTKATTPDYTDIRQRLSTALNESPDEASVRADTNALIQHAKSIAPQTAALAQQQATSLNRVYGPENQPGSFAFDLAASRRAANAAETQAGRQAALGSILGYNMRNQVEGAGSYASSQLADSIARQNIDIAARAADRQRADIGSVLGAQQQIAGQPQGLLTTDVLTGQIPLNARNQLIDTEARAAADRLRNLGMSVNVNTLTDQLTTLGRQLGLSGQALAQYLQSRYHFLDSPQAQFALPNIRSRGVAPMNFNPNDFIVPSGNPTGAAGALNATPDASGGWNPGFEGPFNEYQQAMDLANYRNTYGGGGPGREYAAYGNTDVSYPPQALSPGEYQSMQNQFEYPENYQPKTPRLSPGFYQQYQNYFENPERYPGVGTMAL